MLLAWGRVAQRYPPKAQSRAFGRARHNIALTKLAILGGELIENTKMWYTYILYCKIRKVFYIGFTSDLKRRMQEHLSGSNHTTKRMQDIELVYYEACRNEADARAREKSLKTGFGRGYIKNRLKNYLNE